MMLYARSCERPSKSSASVFFPSSVSNSYSFSTGTQGSCRRCSVTFRPSSACSASSFASSSRAACHSSRVPIVCSGIVRLLWPFAVRRLRPERGPGLIAPVDFAAGPNERPDDGLGDGGHRLHEWALTKAGGDPEEQWPLVTYVDDVRTAMSEAKRAAGDKNVLVHGAGTAQLALAAGVLDEIEIHLIPVLFGQGRRLFEHLRAEHIELERTRILEGEDGVTHLR